MDLSERSIVRTLQSISDQAVNYMTEQDAMFLYKASNRVTHLLLEAEQPYNDEHVFHIEAQLVIKHMEQFIAYRKHEKWCEPSRYPYKQANHATRIQP